MYFCPASPFSLFPFLPLSSSFELFLGPEPVSFCVHKQCPWLSSILNRPLRLLQGPFCGMPEGVWELDLLTGLSNLEGLFLIHFFSWIHFRNKHVFCAFHLSTHFSRDQILNCCGRASRRTNTPAVCQPFLPLQPARWLLARQN